MSIVYATLADMQERYTMADLTQLSDWDGTGAINAARIAAKLADAGATIDAYVSSKYGDRSHLPVPPLLELIACQIAFRLLHRGTPPEGVLKAHDRAIDQLRDIAAGRLKLDEGNIDALPARPGAIHIEGRRRFTRSDLDKYA